jgi:translation initiation factor IF-1
MTDGDGTVAGDAGRGGQLAYVIGPLANSMFRLRMVDGREIVAHAAKDLRMAFTRLLPDDQVLVDVSAFDPNKARIRKVLKSSRPSQHDHPPNHSQQREMS